MSAVPDKVLNWLYSILTSEYHDVNGTYSAVAQTLSSFPSLSPRTEVYTDNNGISALLLLLSGTIPVQFRGTVYRFPIAIWVPHAYPVESPIVFVTPSKDMMLRPGQQHVGMDGKVYHPYLAQWGRYSSILDFLSVLRSVFAKEPPVVSRQQQQYTQAEAISTPPPIPQLPEELRRPQTQSPAPAQSSSLPPGLPPLPPKPGHENERQGASPESRQPPPLPLLPPQVIQLRPGQSSQWNQGANMRQLPPLQFQQHPQRQDSWPEHHSQTSFSQTPQQQHQQSSRQGYESPVSPISPSEGQFQRTPSQRYQQRPQPPHHLQQQFPQQQQHPTISSNHAQYPPPANTFPHPPQQALPPQISQKPAQPLPNLLDSDLDVMLPSQRASQVPLPVPVVPPNPEKDHLLQTISTALRAQLLEALESNQNALPSLQAQNTALQKAYIRLQSEVEELQRLDAMIATNERILRETMRDADRVIESCKGREQPDVDEVPSPPTIVAKQLWREIAEERSLKDARTVLGEALDKGRISGEVFIKQTRSLAREEFKRKALIKKIAKGMGLDDGAYGRDESFY